MNFKKILSTTLCVAITTALFTGVCSAANRNIVIDDSDITKDSLSYDLILSQGGTLITTIYNSDGMLVKTELDTVEAGTKTKTLEIDDTLATGTAKFMLWDNLGQMTPVSALVSEGWDVNAEKIVKVMPLGDSITDGYTTKGGYRNTLVPMIETAGISSNVDFVGSMTSGTGYDMNHEGHSGWAIAAIAKANDIEGRGRQGLTTNIDSWMTTYNPDVVMLQIGTNDILSQYDLANAQTRLETLVDKIIAKLPERGKIYIATIPYIDVNAGYNKTGITDQSVMNTQVDTFNTSVRAVAEANGLTLVEMNTVLTLSDLKDGIHPSAAGYAKMGEFWYNTIIDELNKRID